MATYSPNADRLGALRAQIDILNAEARLIENQMKGSGESVFEGELFRVNVSHYERKSVAWQKIARQLGASPQIIAGNTSRSEVARVIVTAKLKEVA